MKPCTRHYRKGKIEIHNPEQTTEAKDILENKYTLDCENVFSYNRLVQIHIKVFQNKHGIGRVASCAV